MSLRTGFRYGWWKRPTFWVTLTCIIPALAMYLFLMGLWFRVWTP